MSIVGPDGAPRKGRSESQLEVLSSSAELETPWATVEDDWTDESPEELTCPDEDVLSFSTDQPAGDMDPRGTVEAWRIAALGRRPKDHLARDLMLSSLWRDERPRVFHNLAKKPPAWIQDHVRHLPGTQEKQASQLTVLHYLHRRQLRQLSDGDVATNLIGDEGGQLLTRLWDCWPYGAKMLPPVHAQTTPHGCWCRLAWLCPWCYARRAVSLERLLREGPLRNPRGKHLVLARFATYGEQASPDLGWSKRWSRWCGTHYLQGPRKVRRMRAAVTATLRRYARDLGITGGIITHQISPWRTKDYRRGVAPGLASFRHDYALLGEVTFRDEDEADRFQDETAYRSYPYGAVEIKHPFLAECYNCPSIAWSFHSADDPKVDTLRLFLAGSSVDYPVGNLEWHAGGMTARPLTRNGIRGALALQPHFMMDEVQWWSYAEAARGLPLYVPFGSWRDTIGEAKLERAEQHKEAVGLPSPTRRAASRRRQGLKDANARRKRQAREELDRLLEVARPLLKQAMAEQSGRRGRPAYRTRLKELLEKQGCTVSEHRLKQLVRELGS